MYRELFKGIRPSDTYGLFEKWEEYLGGNLKFPFEVEVAESDRGDFHTINIGLTFFSFQL